MHDLNKEFRRIPGIGKKLADELIALGFKKVTDLRNEDPERMYHKLCKIRGAHIDRCVLYVFRCAVYFASEPNHKAHLLKWWNWKDKNKK